MFDGPEPAPGRSRQVYPLVDHQPGHLLPIVPPADLQLLVQVQLIAFAADDEPSDPDHITDVARVVGREGEGQVVGVAGVRRTDFAGTELPAAPKVIDDPPARGEPGQARVEAVIDEVAQSRTGRRALRKSPLKGAEVRQQSCRGPVPADASEVLANSLRPRGRE